MTGSLFAEPSQLARRRLRIAQQAFRSADGLATAGVSDADRVAAVVQFDFAVETVLRALLYEARSPKAHVEGFRELLNATRESLKGGDVVDDVPGRAGLQQLRGIRNAAQHEARVPRSVEVVECSVHARDALVEIAHVAWNVDFFAADVDAVKSERVAELVRRAVKAYSGDDTHGAMGWLSSAFHYAFTNGGENLVGSDVDVIEIVVRDQDQWRQSDRPDPFGKGGRAAI